MRVAAYVPDLMDRSRLSRLAGIDLVFVGSLDRLGQEDASVVVADLSRPGAVEALAAIEGPRAIGFFSHVDTAIRDSARSAGIETCTRSRFFSQTVSILTNSEQIPVDQDD